MTLSTSEFTVQQRWWRWQSRCHVGTASQITRPRARQQQVHVEVLDTQTHSATYTHRPDINDGGCATSANPQRHNARMLCTFLTRHVAIIYMRAAHHTLPSRQYGLWVKCGPVRMQAEQSSGPKSEGLLCPFAWRGSWVPIWHNVPRAEAYLHTKWYLNWSIQSFGHNRHRPPAVWP